jgi:hypothetical protein
MNAPPWGLFVATGALKIFVIFAVGRGVDGANVTGVGVAGACIAGVDGVGVGVGDDTGIVGDGGDGVVGTGATTGTHNLPKTYELSGRHIIPGG